MQGLFDIELIDEKFTGFIVGKQLGFYKQPSGPILKWIGSKYKHAKYILPHIPRKYNTFIEPFLGSGAILGHVAPNKGIAGDILYPLIDFWGLLKNNPQDIISHYEQNIQYDDKKINYNKIKERFNQNPNGLDMLMLSRLCYGGVIRFTKDGKMSTPVGPHSPIALNTFINRVRDRNNRIKNTEFYNKDFSEIIDMAGEGDVVYCDPPYVDSQTIIYGAQGFDLIRLLNSLKDAKNRGAYVMLSIDGQKRSGNHIIEIKTIEGLFEREVLVDCGISMLNRLQRDGQTMENEQVHDRLLLSR